MLVLWLDSQVTSASTKQTTNSVEKERKKESQRFQI